MKPISVKLSKSPQSSFKYKRTKSAAFQFNWHCHPEYEVMLMVKSQGKRFVGDHIYDYGDGDLVFFGSNLPHTLYSPAGVMGEGIMHEAILIQFVEHVAGLNVANVPELKQVHRLFTDAARGIKFHGKTREVVAKKIVRMGSLEGLEKLMQLLTILDTLGQACEEEREFLSSVEFNQSLKPNQQSRIDRVCTYLNRNYKHNLRLEDAAAIANMSVTAFSRFFKKSTGKTLVEYVNELRVGQACKLLIESESTIAEICYDVGFNSISNFNRRFCERHNMSPKKYRKEFAVNI
jgi:AraC-like DNA-binding protein